MKYLSCKPDFDGAEPTYNIGDTIWHNQQEWTVWGLRWQDPRWHYHCQSQQHPQNSTLVETEIQGRIYRPPLPDALTYAVGAQFHDQGQTWTLVGAFYREGNWDHPPCYVVAAGSTTQDISEADMPLKPLN